MKKIFLFIAGGIILILGISLILKDWVDVVIVFKGIAGIVLALAGMLMLFLAR